MTKRAHISAPIGKFTSILGALLLSYTILIIGAQQVSAACPALPSTNGVATSTINVPADGTYNVWVRMLSPDGTADTIYLEIEDQLCGTSMGGTALTASTWKWVDYQNGNTNNKVSVSLNAGTYTLKMTGNEAGVGVDRVLLLTDTCTPTGTGDNCAGAPDLTPPSVNITQPAEGVNVSGSITISADASDNDTLSGVDFYIDGSLVTTDTTAPYSYAWDTTTESEGAHSIYSVARDEWNNSTQSSTVNVTVANVSVGTASVNLSPANGNYEIGDVITTTIFVDSGTDNMDTAQVRVNYDQTQLRYDSYNAGNSGFNTSGPVDDSNPGYVKYVRGNTTSVSGNNELLKINFTVLGPLGATALTLDQTETTIVENGTALTVSRNGANYSIVDQTAPTAPTNVRAVANGFSQISITWSASVDTVGVDHYEVWKNGTLLAGNVNDTSFIDVDILPNTVYTYNIVAVDASGNSSNQSADAVVNVSAKTGDFNFDGSVDIFDLSIFLSNWGTNDTQTDLNANGTVDIFDFSIFLSNWGS